jgi:glycosyltransferase involved in cell wall biosynthesis
MARKSAGRSRSKSPADAGRTPDESSSRTAGEPEIVEVTPRYFGYAYHASASQEAITEVTPTGGGADRGDAPWYARATLPRRVGVVIPTRDRPTMLPHMLGSLRMQTHRPERVLVVDDGETSAEEVVRRYPGVEYLRARVGDGLSGNPARNVGLRALADLPYLCFLDDDDMIPPDYLEVLLESIEADCRAAAAYPRMRFCGRKREVWSHPWDPEALGRMNLSGVAALIRTDALLQVGGWPVFAPDDSGAVPHDDWALWRRLRDHGWRMTPAPVDYYYFRHDEGVCRVKEEDRVTAAWGRTIDPVDLVTLAIPWSGRMHLVDEVLDAIDAQTFPAEHLHVLFYDNSGDPACGRRLRRWLLGRDRYASVSYVRDPRRAVESVAAAELADAPLEPGGLGRRRHGRALNDRVGALWNRIGQLVKTDLVWCVEDDVIPPPGALRRLLDAMGPNVDAVTASYASRVVPGCEVAWRYDDLRSGYVTHLPRGRGVEEIGGCGFGCALVRADVFRAGPARSAGEAVGYDCNIWLDLARRGGQVLIDWDLACEHRVAPGRAGGRGRARARG